VIHISTNNRVEPGAAVLTHDHIPDNDGCLLDKTGVRYSGLDTLKRSDHGFNLG
jgi:hypothetical protein